MPVQKVRLCPVSQPDHFILPVALRLAGLLLATAIFIVIRNGLAGTLLGVRAGLEGMPVQSVGLLMSAYRAG